MDAVVSRTTLISLLLIYICEHEKVYSKHVYKYCEEFKRAVALCDDMKTMPPYGYLKYDVSTDPSNCSCQITSSKKSHLEIAFASSIDTNAYTNGSYADTLNISSNFSGSWYGSISESDPWSISVSTKYLSRSQAELKGYCLAYKINEGSDVTLTISCGGHLGGSAASVMLANMSYYDARNISFLPETRRSDTTFISVVYAVVTAVIVVAIIILISCIWNRKLRKSQDLTPVQVCDEIKDKEECVMVEGSLAEPSITDGHGQYLTTTVIAGREPAHAEAV